MLEVPSNALPDINGNLLWEAQGRKFHKVGDKIECWDSRIGWLPYNEAEENDTVSDDADDALPEHGANRTEKRTPYKVRDMETIISTSHDKDNPYIMLNRKTVTDNDQLSFRARGLLAYMLNRPQGWRFNALHLSHQSPEEGRDAIYAALKELRVAGYIRDGLQRDEKGRIEAKVLFVYEKPSDNPEFGAGNDKNGAKS